MRELIKSFLLLVLTISAIVMTGAIFVKEDRVLPVTEIEYETTDLIEYIKPQNYVFSFGDLFIKLYDDKYNGHSIRESYENAFKAFIGSTQEFNKAEISERLWQEQISRKSVMVNFPFAIKLSDLMALNHYTVDTASDINVTSILFVLNKKDLVYIYDGENNRYHRLTGEATDTWMDDIYAKVDEERPKASAYKTIEQRYDLTKAGLSAYNLSEANNLLTPINNEISFPVYNVTKEISSGIQSNDILESYAKKIFGDDLSFVKRSVYSDNSTIFMYGYGEKVFKINNDGSLEYIVKVEENNNSQLISFIEGLAKSVDQINRMGVEIKSMYLAGYYQVPSTLETVYLFNYHKDGIPILTSDTRSGNGMEVRFKGENLVKASKNARFVTNINLNSVQEQVNFEDLLIDNRVQLELQYKEDRPDTIVAERDIVQMCLQEMSELELKYYILNNELTPVWRIKIADTVYLFDLKTGKLITKD